MIDHGELRIGKEPEIKLLTSCEPVVVGDLVGTDYDDLGISFFKSGAN